MAKTASITYFVSAAAIALLGLAACAPTIAPDLPDPAPVPDYAPPLDCGPLLPLHALSGGGIIFGQAYERPILFAGGFEIDADGAPMAYHPDDRSGLAPLARAGRSGAWTKLATDRRGMPFIQGTEDPAPGFYVGTTRLADEYVAERSNPRRYVDAEKVPYVSLPSGRAIETSLAGIGAAPGDLAVVHNLKTGRTAGAIFADDAGKDSLGSGSIALAAALGYANVSPRTGGTNVAENLFIVFAGSAKGWPLSNADINSAAMEEFRAWGGERRLKDCFAAGGTR